MSGTRKTLVYVTRAYDPKEAEEMRTGIQSVEFRQLRWHDFYRFLQIVEKDALVEKVMLFMEEQGMSRSHRLSTTDLMVLSGVPRAFEIFDETLGDEVKAELEALAGSKVSIYQPQHQIRRLKRYIILAKLHGFDLYCFVGYRMNTTDSYPAAIVQLEMQPRAVGRESSAAAMKKIALREGWGDYNLNEPVQWSGVARQRSLSGMLSEEDHIAAIKRFFIESIQQLREEVTEFKKEHPDLPWDGGQVPLEER